MPNNNAKLQEVKILTFKNPYRNNRFNNRFLKVLEEFDTYNKYVFRNGLGEEFFYSIDDNYVIDSSKKPVLGLVFYGKLLSCCFWSGLTENTTNELRIIELEKNTTIGFVKES